MENKINLLEILILNLENYLEGFKRQALHAKSIGFIHPTTKKEIEFECEKPKDFENLLKTIKKLKF